MDFSCLGQNGVLLWGKLYAIEVSFEMMIEEEGQRWESACTWCRLQTFYSLGEPRDSPPNPFQISQHVDFVPSVSFMGFSPTIPFSTTTILQSDDTRIGRRF